MFTFPSALANGQAYAVTVKSKPANHVCYIYNGAGVVNGANITGAQIACGVNLPYNPFTFSPVGGGSAPITVVLTYTITSSAETGGTISPSGVTTKDYGSSQLYTMTPNEFYSVLDVSVDSVSVGAVASYEFTNIQANHTISATFTGGSE